MTEKTMVEKAGEAVGFGIAMAEDVAGAVKIAVGDAVTTVTEVLKKAPAAKAPVKQVAKKEEKMLAEVNNVIAKLKESPLKLGAKTGTSGKIFGSITALQLSRAIREQKGYEIDRKKINITDEVKELGTYKATIDFGNGHSTEVEFEVSAEEAIHKN